MNVKKILQNTVSLTKHCMNQNNVMLITEDKFQIISAIPGLESWHVHCDEVAIEKGA